MWEYNNLEELYHYGILGMRWGKRSPKVLAVQKAYKSAKKDYRKSRFQFFKSKVGDAFRTNEYDQKAANRYVKNQKTRNDDYAKMIVKKASYKAITKSSPEKAQKAEFKTYKKAMQKIGITNSPNDRSTGGKSTALYSVIKAKKGKEYADKVNKKVGNRAAKLILAGAAVTIGLKVTEKYLDQKYK